MTVGLLLKSDQVIQSKFLMLPLREETGVYFIFRINANSDVSIYKLADLIKRVIQICGTEVDIDNKCVIIEFSRPIELEVSSNDTFEDKRSKYNVTYKSHVEQDTETPMRTYFRFNNQIFTQIDASIYPSSFGKRQNVALISLVISTKRNSLLFENVKEYIYGEKDQVKLRQKRLENLDPQKYITLQERIKENDKIRDKTPQRIAAHKKIDLIRDKSSSRKTLHKKIDQLRGATSPRKALLKKADQVRDATSQRKALHKKIDLVRDATSPRKALHKKINQSRNATSPRKALQKKVDEIRDATSSRKLMHQKIDQRRNQRDDRNFFERI